MRFNPQTSWEATFQPPKSRRPRWGAGGGSGEEGRRGKRRPKSVRYLEGKIGEGSFSDPPRVCVHETSLGSRGLRHSSGRGMDITSYGEVPSSSYKSHPTQPSYILSVA